MNNERGFTLIEVLISIFAIVLMSNFIIRMFLVSAQLNQKIHLTDQAGAFASQWAEEFKADPEAVRLALEQNSAEQPAENTYVLYYDADWQIVALPEATYQMMAVWQKLPEYSVAVSSVPGREPDVIYGIIDFEVSVNRVERGEVTSSLAAYATKKYADYFPELKEIDDEGLQ